MRTTEAEAKGMWCCQPFEGGREFCQGSSCMAWRWGSEVHRQRRLCAYDHDAPERRATLEPARPADLPATWVFIPYEDADDFAHWIEPQAEADKRRIGWCGLGGDPW